MAAQAGLCLAGSETPEDMFSRDVAHLILNKLVRNFVSAYDMRFQLLLPSSLSIIHLINIQPYCNV